MAMVMSEIPEANRRVETYFSEKPLKHHERRMIELVAENAPGSDFRLLDIGCASGNLLAELGSVFPSAHLDGLEMNKDLATTANEKTKHLLGNIFLGDASKFETENKYDLIVASGILSMFEDPFPILDLWHSWLKDSGTLLVFGRFNSKKIDVRVKYYNHALPSGWEDGLTSFSTMAIADHIEKSGFAPSFERFQLPIGIEEHENPIRTYTLNLASGERLVVNGANIIAEHHFLVSKSSK